MTRFAIAAAVLTAGISAAANATTWTMTFTNVTPNQVVGINYNAARSFSAGPVNSFNSVYAGQMNWAGPYGKSYSTFCTQINENINYNQTVNYTQTAVSNVPDAPGTPGPMGALKATILQDLYHRHYATVKSSGNAQLNAAFQLAIWEITHENITALTADGAVAQLNMAAGALQMNTGGNSNSGLYALATSLLADLGVGGFNAFDGLLGLTHPSAQDQLIVVPVPVPAMLAGLGLLGAAALRRRMK